MNIFIMDDIPPESLAMLQALYSRDPASVLEHRKKVEAAGPDKFLQRYYVGYGHKSIGDCGSTTIFIEGVSMLAAKAIQDWPLYKGQEASTRYMDFSAARVEDPVGSTESQEIQQRWMDFYLGLSSKLPDLLREQFPRQDDEKEDVYERAIKARSFDVCRAFLPAGTATSLSWHTDLRQAADHCAWLTRHPEPGIRQIGNSILAGLETTYPSSFTKTRPDSEEVTKWMDRVAELTTYAETTDWGWNGKQDWRDDTQSLSSSFRGSYYTLSAGVLALLRDRPPFVELPPSFAQYGQLQSEFVLDFGSFRDLQRHRNGVVQMPLLTTGLGFHPWYLAQLPDRLRESTQDYLRAQTERIEALGRSVPREVLQNYISMGYRVPCRVTQPLPGFLYRVELRTGPSVHPTLRAVAQREAELFAQLHPDIAIHPNTSPDAWSTRRGTQTILEKNEL